MGQDRATFSSCFTLKYAIAFVADSIVTSEAVELVFVTFRVRTASTKPDPEAGAAINCRVEAAVVASAARNVSI
jgi:hypothetical protein